MDIHQNNDNLDTSLNDQNYDSIDNSVDLLVKQKVKEICMKTSDPKGTFDAIIQYMGIQLRRQKLLGRIWFMGQLLMLNIFPHETQVLSQKITQGCNWRKVDKQWTQIYKECRKIVQTRIEIAHFDLRKLEKKKIKQENSCD